MSRFLRNNLALSSKMPGLLKNAAASHHLKPEPEDVPRRDNA
jgi:hypothetical protein